MAAPPVDLEKLGAFYLGRVVDPEAGKTSAEPLLVDAKDFTTHAVCVGMTGSGKTGLCVSLLEEAALDGLPALVIDPKGDLGNLMLTFPELRPEDFRPWLDEREAARAGTTPDALAAETAERWRKGLADWGQDPARIARFRAAADVAIYTPGSGAGLPLAALRSFAAPPPAVAGSPELLRERISGAVSGLLALVGIEADPLRSREHILLSSILGKAWAEGRDLDLGGFIRAISAPSFDKIGVLDLESFYPAKERFELTMALNNLLASPGFAAWTEGAPLDIGALLHTPEGKPRISVLSIAHLSDAERMFFVTLVLNEVVAWMRTQSGTSSLRALLFMDEIFGYFPPTAAPPSKLPMLTLLKQARAFGLGVVLATQNPVDLDYKGLANAGIWFVGRLQTERDKMRVLDGLEGAMSGAGQAFDRQKLDVMLSGLASRVFLMNDVHEPAPVLFQTRWALSYLGGPMTREGIQRLMGARRETGAAATPGAAAPSATSAPAGEALPVRAVLPPEVTELFVAPRDGAGDGLIYRPAVYGAAKMHFVNTKVGLDRWDSVALLAPLAEDSTDVTWTEATVLEGEGASALRVDKQAPAGARFASAPGVAARPASYDRWRKALQAHLYEQRSVTLWQCADPKALSRPGESERDFRVRLAEAGRQVRDQEVDKLRKRQAPRVAALQEKLRRSEDRAAREAEQYEASKLDTAVSVGSTILGALLGRKVASIGNLGRARSAARSAGRAAKEKADIARAHEEAETVRQQLADLEAELAAELAAIGGKLIDPTSLDVQPVEVRPRKGDLSVGTVALAWTPWRVTADGTTEPAF
jgi:hypothetical protein